MIHLFTYSFIFRCGSQHGICSYGDKAIVYLELIFVLLQNELKPARKHCKQCLLEERAKVLVCSPPNPPAILMGEMSDWFCSTIAETPGPCSQPRAGPPLNQCPLLSSSVVNHLDCVTGCWAQALVELYSRCVLWRCFWMRLTSKFVDKADFSPWGWWASPNQLKAWVEPKSWPFPKQDRILPAFNRRHQHFSCLKSLAETLANSLSYWFCY